MIANIDLVRPIEGLDIFSFRKRKRPGKKKKPKDKDEKKKKRLLRLIRPFRRLMMRALDRRQIAYDKDNIEDIVQKFYNAFVQRKSAYELETYTLDPATLSVIISAVLSFIKELIAKKKRGDKMTDEEKDIADEGEKADEESSIPPKGEPKDDRDRDRGGLFDWLFDLFRF